MSKDKKAPKNNNKNLADSSKHIFESKEQVVKDKNDCGQVKMSESSIKTKEESNVKEKSVPIEPSEKITERVKPISKREYSIARAKMSRLNSKRKYLVFFSCVVSFVVSLIAVLLMYLEDTTKRYPIALYFITCIIVFAFMSIYIYLLCMVMLQTRSSKYQMTIDLYEFENMQDEVEENLFESSIKMSYKYLDQYYAQTKDQANKGFLLTICVTIAGAILLFVGIIFMFINRVDASRITVASGVIVEFISAIMFYLYNKTVQSMGNYHDKLFLSQNVAIALKISDSITDEKRDDIKTQIVKELITDVNAYIVASDDKNESNEKTKEG